MTPREETARRFAEAMGWTIWTGDKPGETVFSDSCAYGVVRLPAADAPMPEQGAFVFRVAEALGCGVQLGYDPNRRAAWVAFDERLWGSVAPDLCHAAMLAGIAAKEGA